MSKKIFVTMALLVIVTTGLQAAPPADRTFNTSTDDKSIDLSTWIDANKLLMFVTNRGSFGYDQGALLGRNDGLYYPFTTLDDILSGLNYKTVMFAAGPWIAGVDNATGNTLVSVAEYSDDYYPGNMIGGSFDPNGETDPKYRVYKIYSDSLAGNPSQDYLDWPVTQGAPVDSFGYPKSYGDMTLWSVYNDDNPSGHINDASTGSGLGIEIQQTVWADTDSNVVGPKDYTIYLEYKLYNKGGKDLRDCYFSIWCDPDLGNAGDDFIGCDSADNLYFCYNDGDDSEYGFTPPAVGVKILYGPLVPSASDTANFGGNSVPGFKNLGMTSHAMYSNGIDPQNPSHSYNLMRGLDRDGAALIDPSNGMVTTYAVSGDPVTGTGWVDVNSADRRMMGTCGPFNMAPGDSQYVLVRMAVGQGPDRLSSITSLRDILNQPYGPSGSCCLNRGDMDRSGGDVPVDIGDLTYLIDFMFRTGPPAICAEESDVNADGITDISDLIYIVDFIFRGGPLPPGC